MPKNVARGRLAIRVPAFVKIPEARFTTSTAWFGPTARWTSGGVRSLAEYSRASHPEPRTGEAPATPGPLAPAARDAKDPAGRESGFESGFVSLRDGSPIDPEMTG